MTFPSASRLAVEVALDECANFRFGLRQCHDVGATIELTLGVAANDLVLPKRKALGIGLIHSGNADVRSLQRIKHIDVAKVAWIECEFDFQARAHPPSQLSQLRTVIFQAL